MLWRSLSTGRGARVLQRFSVAVPRPDGVAAAVLARTAPCHPGGLGQWTGPAESSWRLTRAEAAAGDGGERLCVVCRLVHWFKGMSSKGPGVYRHATLLRLG
jgi:hypothetical protein